MRRLSARRVRAFPLFRSFLYDPGRAINHTGHRGITQRRACISHSQIPHSAGTRGSRDTTRPTPPPQETRTMAGQTVGVGVRTNLKKTPTTDHTKKHAPTSKASTRGARATVPSTAPGAAPKQRDKTPARPRRKPDDTGASKRQPFARINDDTQPNKRRLTNKGSRMRARARVREP